MFAFVFLFFQHLFGQSFVPPQEVKVTLAVESASLRQVFKEIERQTDYHFFYSNSQVDSKRKVTLNMSGSATQLLDSLFEGTDISWEAKGNQIVLKKQKKQPMSRSNATTAERLSSYTVSTANTLPASYIVASAIVVAGTVTDESGNGIEGVNVQIKGDSRGTLTDKNGGYSIDVPDGDAVLIFSFVGFVTQEIKVGNKNRINVSMLIEGKAMQEVVVVGFGEQKKSSLTAAITTVNTDQLINIPNPNVLSALQGRVAGLTINESSGAPGSSPAILVRGIGTIDGGTGPLIVIDGVPGGGDISNIPAYDIESISVLKDASAAAIYGARAANGVILITTKRGSKTDGTVQVSFNSHTGFQTLGQIPTKLDAKQYANLLNEVYQNDGQEPVFDDNDMNFYNNGLTDDLHGNTDWHKVALYDHSPIYTNHIGISGNSKIGRYYISGEHMSQRGLLKMQDKVNRTNLRANIVSDITSNLQLSLSTAYTKTHSLGGSSSNHFGNIFKTPAIGNATVSDGHYGDMIYAKGFWLSDIANVWHWMNVSGPNSLNWNNFIQNGNLVYTPAKGLTLNVRVGYNLAYADNSYYTPIDGAWNVLTNSYAQQRRNSYSESWSKSSKTDYQVTAAYETELNENYFKLMAGYSQEQYRDDWISASRRDYINDLIYDLSAGDPSTQENAGGASHWAVASFFGRFNYAYKDKYLLEANARYDGSSRFSPQSRWGLFPSVSAGWNIHQERFLENHPVISRLKLRGSWGQLGNSEKVGLYLWYAGVSSGGMQTFDDKMVMGIRPSRFANTGLSWETTTSSNVGLETSLWQGKLSLEVDFWKKVTNDILLTVPVSTVIGAPGSSLTVNAGKVGSHGFDITLISQGNITSSLTYDARFSITGWNSWLIDIGDRATPFSTEFRPGADLGNMYGYQALGIINDDATLEAYKSIEGVNFSQIKKGDLHYKDQNGDGKLDHRDVVKIGNGNTKNNYGLNLTLGYRGFDVAFLFQGAFNVDRWISGDTRQTFINFASPEVNHLDRWTDKDPNPDATYPRLRRIYSFNNANSDWWVRNGSYLRFKNFQIGYAVPESVLSRTKLKKVRVFAAATNLFTIAPDFLKGYNPEADMQGYIYPTLRTYAVGLNINL